MKINAPALLFFFTLASCLLSNVNPEHRSATLTDEAFSFQSEHAFTQSDRISADCLPTGNEPFPFLIQLHEDG